MTAIDVTPAGNQLYAAEISDEDGTSHHEVTVPDAWLERLDTRESSVQDLVFAALAFLTTREGHQQLDARIDLAEVDQRYEGFGERVAELAKQRALRDLPRDPDRASDQTQLSGDDRLVEEVRQEQRDGQVTPPPDTL